MSENSALLVIDVQGKLSTLMHEADAMFAGLRRSIAGAQALDIPVLVAEQLPEKLGATSDRISDLLETQTPISKSSFSAMGHAPFADAVASLGRKHLLICGIETHICVYQTALDCLVAGYEVSVITDAVGSRLPENKQLALDNLRAAGATIVSSEMWLFQMMRSAGHPAFRTIQQLVK